jgi:TrmH family RNA methyltransferase
VSGQAELKQVRALHQKKSRDEQGLFLVQGRKLVAELLRSDWQVRAVHATEQAAKELALPSAQVHPDHVLDRMGTLEAGNEVVAVVRKRPVAAMDPPRANELVLALDGITDPGNLGTVLRIADWFGASGVWCADGSVDAYNPKCVQASMGSLFRVPVAYGDLPSALRKAAGEGVAVYKADMAGSDVFTSELRRPAALVLGSESHGLSAAVRDTPGILLAIPSFGGAESLNVATAAAALCMEFARRSRA